MEAQAPIETIQRPAHKLVGPVAALLRTLGFSVLEEADAPVAKVEGHWISLDGGYFCFLLLAYDRQAVCSLSLLRDNQVRYGFEALRVRHLREVRYLLGQQQWLNEAFSLGQPTRAAPGAGPPAPVAAPGATPASGASRPAT